ncbi:MAG: hypothetical protein OEW15_13950 [Nitrospirota bacterium]|nr:hypothetical protein [Nitrospirota bacterium]
MRFSSSTYDLPLTIIYDIKGYYRHVEFTLGRVGGPAKRDREHRAM